MYLKRRMQICFLNTVRMIAQLTFNRVVTLDFFWEIMSERRRLDVPEHPRIHHTVRLDLLAVGSGERYGRRPLCPVEGRPPCRLPKPTTEWSRRTADSGWTQGTLDVQCIQISMRRTSRCRTTMIFKKIFNRRLD
jgi:hypothetical protein